MPQTCTVCRHPQRLEIEQAIIGGAVLRTVAERYGPSKTALLRHREHFADTMARVTEAREVVRTEALLDNVRAGEGRAERLYSQAEQILSSALQDGDRRTALQAIRAAVDVMNQARSYLELRGELTGELGRDRMPAAFGIQIICPATAESRPQLSYANDADFEEIGLLQRPV